MYILQSTRVRIGARKELQSPQEPLEFVNANPLRSYEIPNIIGIDLHRLDVLIHQRLLTIAPDHEDIKPEARAFLYWLKWMKQVGVGSPFVPTIALVVHPTYGFKYFLNTEISESRISRSTAIAYLGVIRRFYIWLGDIDEVDVDEFLKPKTKYLEGRPVQSSDLSIRGVGASSRSLNPLLDYEQETFKTVLLEQSDKLQLMLRAMRDCGLRLDECLSLPSNLFNDDVLANTDGLLVKNIYIGPENDVRTKFKKRRELFIIRTLYEAFLDYLISDEYEHLLRKFRAKYGDSIKNEPVFITRDGDPYTSKPFYTMWYAFRSELRKVLGDEAFKHKPHDLRATFGSNWLRSALNAGYTAAQALAALKKVMGHESESTTMKYIRFNQENEMSDKVAGFMDEIAAKATMHFQREDG